MEKNVAEKSKTDSKAISRNHYTINAEVRSQRNHAEKQRRDRLNDHIAQLAAIVPPVAQASRPLDKVSILRLAASWMRLNYTPSSFFGFTFVFSLVFVLSTFMFLAS